MKKTYFTIIFITLVLLCGCEDTEKFDSETAITISESIEAITTESNITTFTEPIIVSSTETTPAESTTSAFEEITDEYLKLGCEKGLYYRKIGEKYFHTSADCFWVGDSSKKQFIDSEADRHFTPIIGLTDGDSCIPMNYSDVKNYFYEMGVSEHAFTQFQSNANGAYYEFDGQLYVGVVDGGLWGWDCSFIDNYILIDENTIKYNCIWIGYAGAYNDGYWGYEEDKTESFTFTLKNENGNWTLYECSNPYAFFAYFVGMEDYYNGYQ